MEKEQNESLEDLRSRASISRGDYDLFVEIIVTLEDYQFEHERIENYNQEELKDYLINLGKTITLTFGGANYNYFNTINETGYGWFEINEDNTDSNIYIKKDGIMIYQWHYNDDDIINDKFQFPSVELSWILALILKFLIKFYNKIKYNDQIIIDLTVYGLENSYYSLRSGRIIEVNRENMKNNFKRKYKIDDLNNSELARSNIIDLMQEILRENFRSVHFEYSENTLKRIFNT